MLFGPDYRESNNSYTFNVISGWIVANCDVSLNLVHIVTDMRCID